MSMSAEDRQELENYPPASILIVDDNVRDLIALQSVLEPLGHEIVTAPSGERALELVTARDFATILLDVRMSGLDGFETVARLTELGRVPRAHQARLRCRRGRLHRETG